MDATSRPFECEGQQAPYHLTPSRGAPLPLIVASPHSGMSYPMRFLAQSRLDLPTLRRSEDAYMDLVAGDAPEHGASLLCATFPRVFCDVNRAAWELDPGMFRDPLPPHALTRTEKVRAGLGMIPRLAASGRGIYRAQLSVREAEDRLATCWLPYHAALSALLARASERFGIAVLIDAHSMPRQPHLRLPDIVLGDAHGESASPAIVGAIEAAFIERGYRVGRNAPYAGGYVTRHYGRPAENRHVVQIEILRTLYMNEATMQPHEGLGRLRQDFGAVLARVAALLAALPGVENG